jgi:hypothetical protein
LQIFEEYQKMEILEMKSTSKIRKPDGKIPNVCKIEIMNVIVTIRFI